MKKYGIYLAYPPTVDLTKEGLGRFIAEFLKGAQEKKDVSFVIACPSWMRESLSQLFESSGVKSDCFEIIGPEKYPLLLRIHQQYLAFKKRQQSKCHWPLFFKKLNNITSSLVNYAAKKMVSTHSIIVLVTIGFISLPYIFYKLMLQLFSSFYKKLKYKNKMFNTGLARKQRNRLNTLASQPKENVKVVRLYRLMEDAEAAKLKVYIETRNDVAAWYCPTAFWPHFNQIKAPRLMCVPDVVLADFPLGFAQVGGSRFLEQFRLVEQAISGGENYVTYSFDVKWRTLVDRYYVEPENVFVVPHGANRLDDLIRVTGFPDNEAATDILCRKLLCTGLQKNITSRSLFNYSGEDMQYIFYASQIRPNKNVITLLRAYEYLLRKRYVGHKLILTGDPKVLPEIASFISGHHLENDVLCLYGLSAQELAACYRLADLAVNPSLSEGGCPFTFTEAMSVGTPAVMSRIPVTEEVIVDPIIQEQILFDPYDWQDMADKIEWGIKNRQQLFDIQKPLYDKLSQRGWGHVVNEYLEVLDYISGGGNA